MEKNDDPVMDTNDININEIRINLDESLREATDPELRKNPLVQEFMSNLPAMIPLIIQAVMPVITEQVDKLVDSKIEAMQKQFDEILRADRLRMCMELDQTRQDAKQNTIRVIGPAEDEHVCQFITQIA